MHAVAKVAVAVGVAVRFPFRRCSGIVVGPPALLAVYVSPPVESEPRVSFNTTPQGKITGCGGAICMSAESRQASYPGIEV